VVPLPYELWRQLGLATHSFDQGRTEDTLYWVGLHSKNVPFYAALYSSRYCEIKQLFAFCRSRPDPSNSDSSLSLPLPQVSNQKFKTMSQIISVTRFVPETVVHVVSTWLHSKTFKSGLQIVDCLFYKLLNFPLIC
jgi:hypothetical protein